VTALSFGALLLCLAVGVVLLALEVFLTPGLGVKGTLGVLLILGAVVLAYVQHGAAKGTLMLGLAVVVLVAGGWVAKKTVGRRMVLGEESPQPPPADADVAPLLGRVGRALSPLRPSGIAVFGQQRVDVTSESEFLEAGTPVKVVSVEGHRVTVRAEGSSATA
jgi:membrane-bound serine protease (ClpP class)